MSLRRLVFAKTWYILQRGLGGFIQIHSCLPYLRDFERMRSLQEHKPAWSLWKECAVVLYSSSTGTFSTRCAASTTKTWHTQMQRSFTAALSGLTDAQNFGTRSFLQKTHRFPLGTRQSNPGRRGRTQLRTLFSGHRLTRLVPVQDGPRSGGAFSEHPVRTTQISRDFGQERPTDLWSQQSYQWLEHILQTPLQFQVLCNLSKTAEDSGDLRETEILQHFGKLLENWLWSHPLGTYFSSGAFLWHCDRNFNRKKRAGWENPRIRVWCSEPGLGICGGCLLVKTLAICSAKCQPQQPLVWQRPTLWTPTVWRSGKHTGRSHLVVFGFLSCCALHLRKKPAASKKHRGCKGYVMSSSQGALGHWNHYGQTFSDPVILRLKRTLDKSATACSIPSLGSDYGQTTWADDMGRRHGTQNGTAGWTAPSSSDDTRRVSPQAMGPFRWPSGGLQVAFRWPSGGSRCCGKT